MGGGEAAVGEGLATGGGEGEACTPGVSATGQGMCMSCRAEVPALLGCHGCRDSGTGRLHQLQHCHALLCSALHSSCQCLRKCNGLTMLTLAALRLGRSNVHRAPQRHTCGGGEAGWPAAWAVVYQGARPIAPISQLILVHWMAVHWLASTRPPVSPELAFQDQKQIPCRVCKHQSLLQHLCCDLGMAASFGPR